MATENCPFDVTPYDQSGLVKTPNLINLNYTNQDFWSLKSRLVDFIKERFGDSFNDFVESDLAIMLIENWAFIADTLSFKMDQIANEIFIDTVSEIDNAFRLAMLVGFKPQPPIGAKSLWSATISNSLDTDLIINTPVNIPISTEFGPRFIELWPSDQYNQPILDENIVISAGSFLTTAVVGIEGRSFVERIQGTGLPNQFLPLSQGPVIWNSVRVTVDGSQWTQVDYFTDSQPRKEYRIEYDANYNAYVLFGNNRAGMIPTSNSDIAIDYRVGGGVAGNIVTGSVEFQRNYIVQGFNIRIPVTFRNYTKGEYGYSGDTIDDIKRKLPQYLRTQNRVVSGDDIEIFASQFATEYNGQVGKAKAILRNYGCAANVIDLYILARFSDDGLIPPDNGLKVMLKEAFEERKMLTDYICIKDGVIVDVDCAVDVVMDKFYRKFEEEIRERVNRKISGFFLLNNWDYGKTLKSVDLIKSLSDIAEILSVEVNFQTNSENNSGEVVTTRYYEIIRPSIITINFVYE
jgi:hypothetical protein